MQRKGFLHVRQFSCCTDYQQTDFQKSNPNSISSNVSAIRYVQKILSLQDPSKTFLVRKIILGCHQSAPSKDSRLPYYRSHFCKDVKINGLFCKKKNNRILQKIQFC